MNAHNCYRCYNSVDDDYIPDSSVWGSYSHCQQKIIVANPACPLNNDLCYSCVDSYAGNYAGGPLYSNHTCEGNFLIYGPACVEDDDDDPMLNED